jgi:hypothetical protein
MRKPLRVNPLRLFLAFKLTKPTRKYINQLLDLLRQESFNGFRLAKGNNVHMTLKFLGSVLLNVSQKSPPVWRRPSKTHSFHP